MKMKIELYNYDIYPMVFPAGKEVEFTVKPLGAHVAFNGEYTIWIRRYDSGECSEEKTVFNCTTADDGCLRFKFTAESECEHAVFIRKDDHEVVKLNIYALESDLACRYPFRGDLHMHTCRSDGRESPAVVCANYRKKGYDFIVVTDHGRYYPSLEAIDSYKDVNIALNILPGEEVHLPQTDVHIVNAGGLFSVNGLLECKENYFETNGALDKRRFDKTITPPDIVSPEQYDRELDEIEAELKTREDLPAKLDTRSFAVCIWAFNRIREAGGIGIFAHPYWITPVWQIPEVFTKYMLKTHPFDAFEVLGGENYFEHNGFQTAIYYDEYREGRIHPIVGSTDSHGSTEHNRNTAICSTIVFAKDNERASIIGAIKDRYSVAVDTISLEYRLVGEHRLQKYASFLMENYFPVHDRQAEMDGELMFQYINSNATKEELNLISARAEKLMKKYIMIG